MSKALSLIGRWLAVLAICTVAELLPSIWYELNHAFDAGSDEFYVALVGKIVLLVIFIVEAFRFFRSLVAGGVLSTIRHIVPPLMAGAFFFAPSLYANWGGNLDDSIQRARFLLFIERYEECANTSASSFGGNKFKTCEMRVMGSLVRAIVYDTSDQVALPLGARSGDFSDYLMRFESPIFSECDRLTTRRGRVRTT
jgi:hypothetical protein